MRILTLLATIIWAPTLLTGCQKSGFDKLAFDASVVKLMNQQKVVGLSIGIIIDGEIFYTQGYGYQDLKKGIPVTEETVFNWASNSKPLIALLTLMLVDQGLINLDDKIKKYLNGLPHRLGAITFKDILIHQSGLPHYKGYQRKGKFPNRGMYDPEIVVNEIIDMEPAYKKNSKAEYSSYAYIFLSAALQKATRTELLALLKENIINPLNMTSFQLDLKKDEINSMNWSEGYQIVNNQTVVVNDTAHFWKHGAGGYKSNIIDFTAFAQSLMKGNLVSSALRRKMFTKQQTVNGKQSKYGIGVIVSGNKDGLKISHNGKQNEVLTRMELYPERSIGIVVMCNTSTCEPKRYSAIVHKHMKQQ